MTYPLDIPDAINQHTSVSRTLAFTLLHIAFTGLLMVALLMYAPVTFRRRPPYFPNRLEYTDEEKNTKPPRQTTPMNGFAISSPPTQRR